eukprot:1450939-Amphidinium_carterae.1
MPPPTNTEIKTLGASSSPVLHCLSFKLGVLLIWPTMGTADAHKQDYEGTSRAPTGRCTTMPV